RSQHQQLLSAGNGRECLGSHEDAPILAGVVGNLLEAMNHHVRPHPDAHHVWAIMLGPGRMRVCFMEFDTIHLSAVQSIDSPASCLLLGATMANVTLSVLVAER
ncbi:hypothetical protein GGI24_002114, partial [Coemansia furcata]